MTQLLEVVEKLTDEERRKVQDFAEFLLARHTPAVEAAAPPAEPHRISFEGWAGCLAHVHPEMSDAEFSQLVLDERVREAMK